METIKRGIAQDLEDFDFLVADLRQVLALGNEDVAELKASRLRIWLLKRFSPAALH